MVVLSQTPVTHLPIHFHAMPFCFLEKHDRCRWHSLVVNLAQETTPRQTVAYVRWPLKLAFLNIYRVGWGIAPRVENNVLLAGYL